MEIQDFAGRWPGSTKFDSTNMQGTVQELGDGRYRIRLDDTKYPDFWMEFTLVTPTRAKQAPNNEEN